MTRFPLFPHCFRQNRMPPYQVDSGATRRSWLPRRQLPRERARGHNIPVLDWLLGMLPGWGSRLQLRLWTSGVVFAEVNDTKTVAFSVH
jgi:hypothetical protein